jgi:small subunit ribosomal protein S6
VNIYENIVILNASLSDEEIETAAGKIGDLITNSGGTILKTDVWGRRKLAYEIKKQKKGFYILFLFQAPSPVIRKLEDYYKVYDPVVKFMVIRLDKKMMKGIVLAKPEEAAAQKAETPAGESAAASEA